MAELANERGFVSLYRCFEDSEVWGRGAVDVLVFLWFMMRASGKGGYKPKHFVKNKKQVTLKRGQLIFSFPQLQGALPEEYDITKLKRVVYKMAAGDDPEIILDDVRCVEPGKKAFPAKLVTLTKYETYNPKKVNAQMNAQMNAENEGDLNAEKGSKTPKKQGSNHNQKEKVNAENRGDLSAQMNAQMNATKEGALNNDSVNKKRSDVMREEIRSPELQQVEEHFQSLSIRVPYTKVQYQHDEVVAIQANIQTAIDKLGVGRVKAIVEKKIQECIDDGDPPRSIKVCVWPLKQEMGESNNGSSKNGKSKSNATRPTHRAAPVMRYDG